MAEFPALPLWTDAYMADCDHLTDAEHGRYLRLLIAMWRAPRQRLPNDDEWLSRKFGRSIEEVKTELRPIIKEFCKSDGNFITQRRLIREWKYVFKKRKLQSVRAKQRKYNNTDSHSGIAGSMRRCNAPTPTPTPTIEERTTTDVVVTKKGSANAKRGTRLDQDWRFDEATIALARAEGVDADREFQRFQNHWFAKPGVAGTKLDWNRTARNWIMRAADLQRGRSDDLADRGILSSTRAVLDRMQRGSEGSEPVEGSMDTRED